MFKDIKNNHSILFLNIFDLNSNKIMIENIITLFMLILLQAVLGFDNLLYISLESKRAPKEKQRYVRKLGIGLAVLQANLLLKV
jgi:predicted tellurium resistance membrane protein TerC